MLGTGEDRPRCTRLASRDQEGDESRHGVAWCRAVFASLSVDGGYGVLIGHSCCHCRECDAEVWKFGSHGFVPSAGSISPEDMHANEVAGEFQAVATWLKMISSNHTV